MPETKDLFQLLNNAQNILVLLNKELTIADLQNLQSLIVVIQSLKKQFQILSLQEITPEVLEYCKEKEIDITTQLKPSEYVVSIDYGAAGVEKVVYDIDKENGKLVFKILPTKSGFSFDKVQFSEGGSRFDGTVVIGIDKPKELESFYDENEYLFKENNMFKFSNVESITPYLIDNGSNLDQEVVDRLTEEFVNTNNLLEGTLSVQSQNALAKLLEQKGNISKSIQKKYYSKSTSYLDLVKVALGNMKTSDNVTYSVIRKENNSNVKYSELSTFGRIPFNVIAGIDLSFLFIEVEEGLALIVESNDDQYSASTIAGVFGGSGDNSHALCILDGIKIDEINKRFWPIIKDLYNIDILGKKEDISVDNSPKVLTKPRRNSKNKGLQNTK